MPAASTLMRSSGGDLGAVHQEADLVFADVDRQRVAHLAGASGFLMAALSVHVDTVGVSLPSRRLIMNFPSWRMRK